MTDDGELFIWVTRWEEFQHYPPERDRGPAWIKTYPAQLDDDRYLKLTDRQRACLHDVRMLFAATRFRLRYDHVQIGRKREIRTRYDDLEALNHAGLIEILSRAETEQRREKLYSRVRSKSKNPPTPRGGTKTAGPPATAREAHAGQPEQKPTHPCPRCGIVKTSPFALDLHLRDVHDDPDAYLRVHHATHTELEGSP